MNSAPQLGRPVEVDSDQIKTFIENNQRYTTRERADILKISKSIKLLVKMKNVFYFTENTIRAFWSIRDLLNHSVATTIKKNRKKTRNSQALVKRGRN